MTTNAGPTLWGIALALAVVSTILRTLIAIGKWDGARFMFVKGSRTANIVGAAVTFGAVILCVVGLLVSLSQRGQAAPELPIGTRRAGARSGNSCAA